MTQSAICFLQNLISYYLSEITNNEENKGTDEVNSDLALNNDGADNCA